MLSPDETATNQSEAARARSHEVLSLHLVLLTDTFGIDCTLMPGMPVFSFIALTTLRILS